MPGGSGLVAFKSGDAEREISRFEALDGGEALAERLRAEISAAASDPDPASIGSAAVAVLAAAAFSGWVVKRQIDKADLVLALKTRE